MDMLEQARKAFNEVRDELFNTGETQLYRLAWRKSRKFYLEHDKDEAIKILKKEANELNNRAGR